MSEYRVIITETLKRAVTVEAESREEAEEAVRHQYQNSERFSRTWADTPSMEAVWTERIPVSGWSSIWRSNAVVKRAGA